MGWKSTALLTLGFSVLPLSLPAQAQTAGKPNILVIMGDDVGYWNISAYNRGMMGYRTPNIDHIAKKGGLFTDYYAQQSCTAGRAAFITGQSPIRTGLLKVGLPSAKEGLSDKDPTLAELLKPQGYMTGQFGKNHLGDRNEFLPTVHGFDEFFGNLYHLNAEEEPENPDYPKNPEFKARFGPRGVMKCIATDTETPGDDPRFGPWGKQKCEDTGPLTKKRMETADEEFLGASLNFIDRAHDAKKPFFVWFNSTRMHIFTHLKPESQGVTGLGTYPDGMVEHDGQVGLLLKKLDDLGIANSTVVIYTTDNGAEAFSWPDGGTTPFRSEKNSNWEGGYRVPAVIRWPNVVKPQTEINGVFSSEDWVPTLMAACGEPDITAKLLNGYEPTERRSRSIWTVTTSVTFSLEGTTSAGSSSTGPTTVIWRVCATISGRSSSSSSSTRGFASGRSRLCRCGRRSSSTSAPTRSRKRTLNRVSGRNGTSSGCLSWRRRRRSWRRSCRPCRNSRRGRSPEASPSATRSTSSSTPRKAATEQFGLAAFA